MLGLHSQAHCQGAFRQLKILTVPSLFIYESILHAKQSDTKLPGEDETHNYDTRHKHIFAQYHRLKMFERKPIYIGKKLLQVLLPQLKLIQEYNNFKIS